MLMCQVWHSRRARDKPHNKLKGPTERCWSNLNTCWRAVKARTREALDAAITHALATIPESDAHAWFPTAATFYTDMTTALDDQIVEQYLQVGLGLQRPE
jgi:hypothetical protein